jgi:hypothetical protein
VANRLEPLLKVRRLLAAARDALAAELAAANARLLERRCFESSRDIRLDENAVAVLRDAVCAVADGWHVPGLGRPSEPPQPMRAKLVELGCDGVADFWSLLRTLPALDATVEGFLARRDAVAERVRPHLDATRRAAA